MSEDNDFVSPSPESEELVSRRIRMNEFRNSGYLTDVRLIVGDVTYRAHKIVLASHCPVFQAMFSSNMLESQSGQVVITDVPANVFSWFLDFLYMEALPTLREMSLANLVDLLVCADKYQTMSLLLALDGELFNRMTTEKWINTSIDAIEVFKIADSFHRVDLKERCTTWIGRDLLGVIEPERVDDYFTKDKEIMIKIIERFHKKVQSQYGEPPPFGPSNCRHCLPPKCIHCPPPISVDVEWKLLTSSTKWFRPKGIKCRFYESINFIVFFNGYGSTYNTKQTSLSLYPASKVPQGFLVEFFVSVSKKGSQEFVSKKGFLVWDERYAHPKLGHRRVELIRWDWCHPEYTAVHLRIQLYPPIRPSVKPPPSNSTVVHEWTVDGQLQPDEMETEQEQEAEDCVELIFGDYSVYVPRSAMLKRIKPYSDEHWRYRTGDIVVDSTEATGRAIVKYILSGRFPETDKVDVPFIEAASTLQLWHLILYAEQALVWNLKPTNVVAVATYGFFNSHSWLVWASAQYLTFHLDRVNSTDQEWKNLPPKYLLTLIREMLDKFDPCLLPTISNSSDN